MKIRSKLLTNAAITIFCLIAIGGIGSFYTNNVAEVSHALVEEQAEPIFEIHKLGEIAWQMWLRLVVHTSTIDMDTMVQLEQEIIQLKKQLEEQVKVIENLHNSHAHKESVEEVLDGLHSLDLYGFKEYWAIFWKEAQQILEFSQNFVKEDAATLIVGEGRKTFDEMLLSLTKMVEEHHDAMAISSRNALETRGQAIFAIVILTFIFVATVSIFIYFINRDILRQVGGEPADIAEITEKVAAGNLDVEFDERKKETGIYASVKLMVNNLRQVIDDVVQVSGGLANGDLSVIPQANYKGDFIEIKTSLDMSLMNLRAVIADIVQMSQGLAQGDRAVAKIKYQGDFVQIKEALEVASAQLLEARISNERETWLKTGLAQLNELMSGEQKIDELAKKVITFLTTYSGGKMGLFYVLKDFEKDHYLELVANYAYVTDKNMILRFEVGEGLVGQAALDKKTLVFQQNSKNCPTVMRSGLGNVKPHYVLFFPLLYENTVKGVIEIGSSKELTEFQRDFLEQAMPIIGIAVNTAESRDKMAILLAQSQEQAEELRVQQEELRTQQENL